MQYHLDSGFIYQHDKDPKQSPSAVKLYLDRKVEKKCTQWCVCVCVLDSGLTNRLRGAWSLGASFKFQKRIHSNAFLEL